MIKRGNLSKALVSWLVNTLGLGPGIGDVFFLGPASTNFVNWAAAQGAQGDHLFTSLKSAYAAMSANRNDVLCMLPGAQSITTPSTGFAWNLDYTHAIGIGPRLHNGGRVRISVGGAMSPFFNISARGCIFDNIHWQYGRGTGTNLIGVEVTYAGNSCCEFNNCDIEGPLSAVEGAAAFNLLKIGANSQDNMFRKCRIGEWSTVCNYATGPGYLIAFGGDPDGVAGNGVTTFEDCTIMGNTSADAQFIDLASAVNGGLGGGFAPIFFNGCRFISLNASCTRVFTTPFSNQGIVMLDRCSRVKFTEYAAVGAPVYSTMPASDKQGGGGLVMS